MCTVIDYQTKEQLERDFHAGKIITVYQPDDMFGQTGSGRAMLYGPHHPQRRKWYAAVVIKNFVVIELDGKRAVK
jgi:hypothetical protein